MHDGAGDEDDDGGEQDREPESGEKNHAQPPYGVFREENTEELGRRLSLKAAGVKVLGR
jgi:hypothetical protein